MEKQRVLAALAALAQETRLDVFRRLVRGGRDGVPAGQVASELEIPPPTLSFHLKELRSAGLVTSEREGRVIRYAPDFAVIAEVVGYLGENCCRDAGGCGPSGRASSSGSASATGASRSRSLRSAVAARPGRARLSPRSKPAKTRKGDSR